MTEPETILPEALYAEIEKSGEYCHIRFGWARREGERIRGDFDDAREGLYVSSQMDARMRGDGTERSYGWHVEYRNVYHVDLRRAEKMVKTLRKVERAMNKFYELRGSPADYSEFVTRVAEALGVKQFALRTKAGESWNWTSSVPTLRYWIDDQERKWHEAQAPKAA